MTRYFKLLFIGILFVFIGDLIIGNILRYYYPKINDDFIYQTTYSINKAKADVLVFGSSRANHHYNPKIIKKITGYSCFNAGKDGQSIFYHISILKLILKRYSPKIIILEYDGNFQYTDYDYDRISVLLPYFRKHKELKDVINLKSSTERFKLLSQIYPYNSTLFSVIKGNLTFFNKINSEDNYNGFYPLNSTSKDTLTTSIMKKESIHTIDMNKTKMFEEFIQLAKKNNITIKVVYSPLLFKYHNYNESLKIAKSICQKHDVEFIDFSENPIFKSNNFLFNDRAHLNSRGANLFTKNLSLNLFNIETYKP